MKCTSKVADLKDYYFLKDLVLLVTTNDWVVDGNLDYEKARTFGNMSEEIINFILF
jgi:hypothetical protein